MCAFSEPALRKPPLSPFKLPTHIPSALCDSHTDDLDKTELCIALCCMYVDANESRSAVILNTCDLSPSSHLTRNEPFLCHAYLNPSFLAVFFRF